MKNTGKYLYKLSEAAEETGLEIHTLRRMVLEDRALAAQWLRGKWMIPYVELDRLRAALPLTAERRAEVMGDSLDAKGDVICRSRGGRPKQIEAAA